MNSNKKTHNTHSGIYSPGYAAIISKVIHPFIKICPISSKSTDAGRIENIKPASSHQGMPIYFHLTIYVNSPQAFYSTEIILLRMK